MAQLFFKVMISLSSFDWSSGHYSYLDIIFATCDDYFSWTPSLILQCVWNSLLMLNFFNLVSRANLLQSSLLLHLHIQLNSWNCQCAYTTKPHWPLFRSVWHKKQCISDLIPPAMISLSEMQSQGTSDHGHAWHIAYIAFCQCAFTTKPHRPLFRSSSLSETIDGALWFWSVIKTITTDWLLPLPCSVCHVSNLQQSRWQFSNTFYGLWLLGQDHSADIWWRKSSEMAHFVFKCNKEDYLWWQRLYPFIMANHLCITIIGLAITQKFVQGIKQRDRERI